MALCHAITYGMMSSNPESERKSRAHPTTAYRARGADGTDHQHHQHLHNYREAEDLAGMLRTTGRAAEATPYLMTRRLP
jgi:hypothetical protein